MAFVCGVCVCVESFPLFDLLFSVKLVFWVVYVLLCCSCYICGWNLIINELSFNETDSLALLVVMYCVKEGDCRA